jgi:hypothetical protein
MLYTRSRPTHTPRPASPTDSATIRAEALPCEPGVGRLGGRDAAGPRFCFGPPASRSGRVEPVAGAATSQKHGPDPVPAGIRSPSLQAVVGSPTQATDRVPVRTKRRQM